MHSDWIRTIKIISFAFIHSSEQLALYPLATSLQQRLIPILLSLVHDVHRLGIGNWMTPRPTALEKVLLPVDWFDVRSLHFDFCPLLIQRHDVAWEALREAASLIAVSVAPLGDPAPLHRYRAYFSRPRRANKCVCMRSGLVASWEYSPPERWRKHTWMDSSNHVRRRTSSTLQL